MRIVRVAVVAFLILLPTGVMAADGSTPEASGAESVTSAFFEATPVYTFGRRPIVLGTSDLLPTHPPFMELTLAHHRAGGLVAEIKGSWRPELWLQSPINIPWGPEGNRLAFENNSIVIGYLSVPTGVGEIVLGRQRVSLGPSPLTNILVSRQVPYVDGLLYTVNLGRWSMTHLLATLDNRRAAGDLAVPFAREGYDWGITTILLSSRRFVWSAAALELGIGAQTIISRNYNAFQAGDVLPVFSIHNAYPGNNNLLITFDGTYAITDELSAYAAVGFDDIDAGMFGIADDEIPTIWAWFLGVDAARQTRHGQAAVTAEVGSTHYLWGSFEDEYPLSRSIYRMRADGLHRQMPLNSPFGPARLWFLAEGSVDLTGSLRVAPKLLLLAGDPDVDLVSLPYAPRETRREFLLLRGTGVLSWDPHPSATLSLAPGFDYTDETFHPSLSLGAVWRTTFEWRQSSTAGGPPADELPSY